MSASAEHTASAEDLRAVIDIGTVTTRLLVAQRGADGIRQLAKEATITNLGRGVAGTGLLAEDAIARTVETVERYVAEMGRFGLRLDASNLESRRAVAIATSAARDASNSNLLIDALRDLGIPLVVISGDREAELSFSGAVMGHAGSDIMVCDIGGGSTELIVGDVPGDGGQPRITRARSHDVGCRRATELFLSSDPPTAGQIEEAARWCRGILTPFFEQGGVGEMIAVAGTATSLVSMWERMEVYDSSVVHGYVLSRSQVCEMLERLASIRLEERRQVVGLQPQRADVIVAGLVIMREVLDLAGIDSFTVSENDNMMGLMATL